VLLLSQRILGHRPLGSELESGSHPGWVAPLLGDYVSLLQASVSSPVKWRPGSLVSVRCGGRDFLPASQNALLREGGY
jgi:hypothetical protein